METNMTTASFDSNVIPYPARAVSRSETALRSLMESWEQEVATDEDESETELMVLLSGMVSPEISLLSDA
jgi:hypothetical protein